MRRIFIDDTLEQTITDEGYAVIRQALGTAECDTLSSYYHSHLPADDRPFTISNWNNDEQNRTDTFNFITAQLKCVADKYLDSYKPVMSVYTIKKPHSNSDMLLHQDWSLVDETKYRSVSIWLALCDMSLENGNLQVASQSHIYCAFPRGMNVPVPFENIRQQMHEQALTNIPLKKGDAVVFEHRLIHASPANNSNELRLAAVCALIPAEAQLIHYYKDPNKEHELTILRLDESQFHLLDFFDAPNKPKHVGVLGTIPALFKQLDFGETNTVKHGMA